MIWTLASATVPVALGFAVALALSRSGRVIAGTIRAVAILHLLLPPAVAAAIWSIVYNPLYGPLDAMLEVLGYKADSLPVWLGDQNIAFWALFCVEVWSCIGFSIIIFTAALRAIDRSYLELARVEGANFWRELRSVILPACARSIALAVIVTAVIGSQVDDLELVMNTNGGPGTSTLLMPLDMYIRTFSGTGNIGQSGAEACILVAMVTALGVIAAVFARKSESMTGQAEFALFRPRVISSAVAIIAGVFIFLPLWWDCLAAFTNGREMVLQPLSIALSHPSFTPFATAWNAGIGIGLWESLVIALVVVAGGLVLSYPAAFGLSLLKRPAWLRYAILALLVITLLQPGDTAIIPLYYLLLQLHLLDTVTGIIIAEVSRELPFAILLCWLTIQSLPDDIVSAAKMDAGEGLHLMGRIFLPLTWPAAAAAGLWIFVSSWSEFTLPNQLLLTSDLRTAPMALATFVGTQDTEFNLLAAGSLLVVLPIVAILFLTYVPAGRALRAAGKSLS